jgi:hypothetical protein
MCGRAVIVPGNHGRIHLKRRQEDGMAKTKVIGGKTVTHLPTRGSATKAGEYDVETGTFIPRPRHTTDDARVGKTPRLKKTPSIGTSSGSQGPL